METENVYIETNDLTSDIIINTNNDDSQQKPEIIMTGTNLSLPPYIFNGCINLSEDNISFLPNVINVGEGSFASCKKFLNLNNKFKTIGAYGFQNCINLRKIDLSECTSIGNYAFKNCENLLGTKAIGDGGVLDDFINIKKITSTNSIGVFENCKSIRNICMKSSIKKINKSFFKNCTSLEFIDFTHLTEVDDFGFYGCYNLTVNENNNLNNITKFGKYSFANCTSLNDIVFNTQIQLGEGVFSNCLSLENITINKLTDKTIPINLFYNCTNLKKISINDKIDKFNVSAVLNCKSIKEIEIKSNAGTYTTYDNKCIVKKISPNECEIIYVCKNISLFTLNDSIYEQVGLNNNAQININPNAFDDCKVSLITLDIVPNITTNVFKRIINGTYHILITKDNILYNDYYSLVGKNHIYYR